ncbi:MAG: TolC family protein [Polyangiaceae bacterium]|nr:TolC family protein [Polyangiaceae bacterium]
MRKPIALGAERKRKTVGPLFGFLLATPLIANVALAETPVAAATDKRLDPIPPPARLITSWEEALRQFRQNSIEFRSALMEQERLSGVARTTSASLLPTSNATVAFTHQFLTTSGTQISGVDPVTNQPQFAPFTVPQSNILSANVGVQWTPLSLAAWRNKKTAAINVEAAQASSADVERTMLLNLAQAAVAVYTTERIAELNRLGLRAAMERLTLTKRKSQLGASNLLDVLRVEQDVSQADATRIAGDESLRQARETFGLALGFPEAVAVSPTLSLEPLFGNTGPLVCRDATVEARADVVVATKREEAAARAPGDVRAEFLPTLGVQSSLQTTTADTGIVPRTTWNIQGILSIPVWDGGQKYGRIRAAEANREVLALRKEQALRTAKLQLTQAMRSVGVAEENRTAAEVVRDTSRETDRLVRVAYQEGQGTSLELVQAATTLRQAEVTLAIREFELVRAKLLARLSTSSCSF